MPHWTYDDGRSYTGSAATVGGKEYKTGRAYNWAAKLCRERKNRFLVVLCDTAVRKRGETPAEFEARFQPLPPEDKRAQLRLRSLPDGEEFDVRDCPLWAKDREPPQELTATDDFERGDFVVLKIQSVTNCRFEKMSDYDVGLLKKDLKRLELKGQGHAGAKLLPAPPSATEQTRLAGNDAFKGGDWARAAVLYTDALGMPGGKTQPAIYTNRAAAFLKLEKFDEALRDATAALQLDPGNPKAFLRRAQARAKVAKSVSDLEDAVLDVESALVYAPNDKTLAAEKDRLEELVAEESAGAANDVLF